MLGENPRQVWLAYADTEVGVPCESLRAGDVIVLRAGELVPIDGTVVQGMASVDQRTLTGESRVVDKAPGDSVLASTMVVAGRLHVRVEKAGEQTMVAHIERILGDTADYTAAVEQKAGAVCDRLAGPTLAAGGASALLLGPAHGVALIGCNLTEVNRATTPLTMLNYLDLTARQGILVKDGRSLELLSGIDTVVFDKTGTLTLEQPHVGQIHCLGELGEDAVLRMAAAAGRQQTHPVARAVVLAATARGLSLPEQEQARYEIGYGVKVSLGGRTVCLGSLRFMHKEGIQVADPERLAEIQEESEQSGCSLVFVAEDALLVGAIEIHSTLRPEAVAVVNRLRARGLQLYIVSGDAQAPTQAVARALGIEHCRASVLPDEKAAIVRQLRAQGRSICFVGDGINDALALKTATVGISLSGAANVALDTAGIILMEQSLERLEVLFDFAAEMESYRQRGYYATLVPGAAGAVGVLFFGMGLPAALLLDMCGIGAALGTAMWPKFVARTDHLRYSAPVGISVRRAQLQRRDAQAVGEFAADVQQ
jgi:Cu2+-exporting ATPase